MPLDSVCVTSVIFSLENGRMPSTAIFVSLILLVSSRVVVECKPAILCRGIHYIIVSTGLWITDDFPGAI